MAPTAGDFAIGIAFVAVGLLKALSDRWQLETTAMGRKTAHSFNHLTLLLCFEQLLQSFFFIFYNAMEKNWMGCGVLYHGDMVYRVDPNLVLGQPEPAGEEEEEPPESINVEAGDLEPLGPAINGDAVPPPEGEVNAAGDGGDPDDFDYEEEEEQQSRRRKPSRLLYLIPGWLWVFQAVLTRFGLILTYSSSFMMLKGTMTIFTYLLGIAFLAQHMFCRVWLGILVSTAGFVGAGLADFLNKPKGGYEKYGVASGALLFVMSQICIAGKSIIEEKYLRKHSLHPMKFLGGEGFYGFILCVALLIVFSFCRIPEYYFYVIPKTEYLEDVVDAFIQLGNSWELILAFVGSIVLHLVWNYLGMFLIRDHGAVPRIMVETLVWMFYWIVCLSLGWENFYVWQVPALCGIVMGLLFYGNIMPLFAVCETRVADINLNRMYPNRAHHRYEPLDQLEEQQRQGEANQDDSDEEEVGVNSPPNGDTNITPRGFDSRPGPSRPAGKDSKSTGSGSSDKNGGHGVKRYRAGATNYGYNGNSSSDEDNKRGPSYKGHVFSSSTEDEGASGFGRPQGQASNRGFRPANSSSGNDDNVDDDSDDELLSLGQPLQMSAGRRRSGDSSSQSSGRNINHDEQMLYP